MRTHAKLFGSLLRSTTYILILRYIYELNNLENAFVWLYMPLLLYFTMSSHFYLALHKSFIWELLLSIKEIDHES